MRLVVLFSIVALEGICSGVTVFAQENCPFGHKILKPGEVVKIGRDECVCRPPLQCSAVKKEKQKDEEEKTTEPEDLCLSSPCQNGGTCIPKRRRGKFRCNCPFPYTGKFCENCTYSEISSADVVVQIGNASSITLTCKAENADYVSWSPLKDERFIDDQDGCLIIRDPQHEDCGPYKCTAFNACGQISVIVKLICSECPKIKLPPKVNIIGKHYKRRIGAEVAFECADGHKLYGNEVINCTKCGKWSSDPPACLPPDFTCSDPEISYGKVIKGKPPYKLGNRVEYVCKKGYANVGSSFQVCEGENELRWSLPAPKCRRKKQNDAVACGDPGHIKNGARLIDGDFSVGDLVHYRCSDGYFLQGPPSIQCLKKGLWSSSPPTCYPSVAAAGSLLSSAGVPEPCNSCVDITFVLDSSSSIRNKDFLLSKELVIKLAYVFEGCMDVRVSLVLYCNESFLEFKYISLSELNDRMLGVMRCRGSTATRRGLDRVRDDILPMNRHCLESQSMPTESGSGEIHEGFFQYPCLPMELQRDCKPCHSVIFLITDGKSNWAGDPFVAANCLKESGYNIFSVGIGPNVDVDELRDVASEPKHKHVLLAANYKKSIRLLHALKQRSE